MNKKLLLASVIAAAISSSASADYMSNDNAYTGFNFGVQGGVSYNDIDFKTTNAAATVSSDEGDAGGTLGGFIGYGYQMDSNFYIGYEIEGAFHFGDSNKNVTVGGTMFKVEADPEYNFAGNLQLGYVTDPGLLLYIFGGINFQEYETKITNIGTGASKKDDKWHVGGKVGFGARYKFYDQVFGDIKYDYNFFNDNKATLVAPGTFTKMDPDQHNVRIGVGMIV